MKGISFLCVLNIIGLLAAAQPASLRFESGHVDMGDIRNWGLQPAVFHFENTGTKPVFILKTTPNPNIRISRPRGYIQPGQKDSIVVYFVPRYREAFSEPVELWTNDRDEPYRLSISGNVISLDECPSPSTRPGQTNPLRLVRVIEQGSGKAIPGAEVELSKGSKEKHRDFTDRNGQYQRDLKPDLYTVTISRQGYESYLEEFYLDRSTMILTFALIPLTEPQPDTSYVKSDTIPTLPPVIISAQVDSIDDKYLPLEEFRQNNIVFLVDVSSSMRSKNKLPLLKTAMKRLVFVLRSVDRVSLIAYANEPVVLSEAVRGSEKGLLLGALDSLEAYGSTHGIKGMTKAYEIAREHFIPGANNIVIIATDGEFNGEEYSTPEMLNLIRRNANEGIACSVIGFGSDTRLSFRMRQMAAMGKGSYLQMSSAAQNVEEVLVDEIKKQSRR